MTLRADDFRRWESRYQTGDTSWDKGAPSPGLVDFLATHPRLPRGTVLVPGCGTGHDVRAWAQAGFNATGLDFAPSAIRLAKERTVAARPHAALGSVLIEAPWGREFSLSPGHLPPPDWPAHRIPPP